MIRRGSKGASRRGGSRAGLLPSQRSKEAGAPAVEGARWRSRCGLYQNSLAIGVGFNQSVKEALTERRHSTF